MRRGGSGCRSCAGSIPCASFIAAVIGRVATSPAAAPAARRCMALLRIESGSGPSLRPECATDGLGELWRPDVRLAESRQRPHLRRLLLGVLVVAHQDGLLVGVFLVE